MGKTGIELTLRPDELAFRFHGKSGVAAKELGVFLQRVSAVSRQKNAELLVTSIENGSLLVVMRAKGKSALQSIQNEFKETPVKTSAAALAVVSAIIYAMSPNSETPAPIAKSAVEIVEKSNVIQIDLITIENTTVIMDTAKATNIRRKMNQRAIRSSEPSWSSVRALQESAREGSLQGGVLDVEGELHFRPDGHSYLVPIDMHRSAAAEELNPNTHISVKGEIVKKAGDPESIIIHSARIV